MAEDTIWGGALGAGDLEAAAKEGNAEALLILQRVADEDAGQRSVRAREALRRLSRDP